jgi:signal transduction histidine kinase
MKQIFVWLCALCTSAQSVEVPVKVSTAFDPTGRMFTINAPGILVARAGFSATIEYDGRRKVLSSSDDKSAGMPVRFADEGVELVFRSETLDGGSGVQLQVGIRNIGAEVVKLVSLSPLALEGRLDGNLSEWLVTAMTPTARLAAPVVALSDIGEPLTIHECGGLYRKDGAGFLFGPVGDPVAYVDVHIAQLGDGAMSFRCSADMEGVLVDPGQTRWGQQVLLLMEPSQAALARWAEGVAKSHGARNSAGALSGWSSSRLDKDLTTGAEVLAVVDEVRRSPHRLRPGAILIDRGYEDPGGKAETNDRFPEGLGFYARRIADIGARPGLRLGLSEGQPPDGDAFILRAREAVQKGFTCLIIDESDFPIAAAADTRKTSFEARRDGFARLREAVGEGIYLVHAGNGPDRAAVGAVDASRMGVPAGRNNALKAISDMLRSYPVQGRLFAVQNDPYYMETYGGWPMARTWMSMVGLSGGSAMSSDPWDQDRFVPHQRSIEVMTPPAAERTQVTDLFTSRHWPRLVGQVTRDWGEWTVALLWNPGATEQSVHMDFSGVGLDPDQRYAAWSFWDNRFLGVVKGSWTTPILAPFTSQHLCFTQLDHEPDRPVLIGSNLHIYCGAVEIDRISSSRGRMEIVLTGAGARAGDLFVYSRWPPFLKRATGCTVNAVDGAGENVWRIGLQDRISGEPQRVELGILLPVTRQAWFWMLIATVAASMLFAGWRYLLNLRLQREHVLAGERTRIAGDIHDEVGANLTQISILSNLAARPTTKVETARSYNVELGDVARETIQSLEEIVWSINPKSDSIRSVAHFICRRAEEILETGKVRCRIVLDETWPDRPMTPGRRHALLLAFKEAMHNILKHAEATQVEVRCRLDGWVFDLRVTDDGCGFDPAVEGESVRREGNGLGNMRRRLSELGGTCTINSRMGEGTEICFRLPLDGS